MGCPLDGGDNDFFIKKVVPLISRSFVVPIAKCEFISN